MRILKSAWNRIAAEVDKYIVHPDVSEDIQQTLARGMFWDAINETWRFAISDSDGRLYVSTDSTKASSGANSAVSVLNTSTQILAANPVRRYFVIYNNGSAAIAIEYDTVAVLASGLIIPSGGMYSDDSYVGAVFGISGTTGQDVRVLEV